MKNKKFFIVIPLVILLVVLSVIIFILLTRNHGISVKIVSPPRDIVGGITKYEVDGASSITEANKAIIKEYYKEDGTYFKVITDSEIQSIANQITADGCGQIVSSYVGPPPVNDARNWVNFLDDEYNHINIYLLDNEYLVQTQCEY